MAREFYTEKDIEDMVKSGVTSLQVTENVSLTALAYEKAQKLGLTLVQVNGKNPSAPQRPYISEVKSNVSAQGNNSVAARPQNTITAETDLKVRIRQAVLQRLGSQVDPAVVDKIIDRVISSTGIKA